MKPRSVDIIPDFREISDCLGSTQQHLINIFGQTICLRDGDSNFEFVCSRFPFDQACIEVIRRKIQTTSNESSKPVNPSNGKDPVNQLKEDDPDLFEVDDSNLIKEEDSINEEDSDEEGDSNLMKEEELN